MTFLAAEAGLAAAVAFLAVVTAFETNSSISGLAIEDFLARAAALAAMTKAGLE